MPEQLHDTTQAQQQNQDDMPDPADMSKPDEDVPPDHVSESEAMDILMRLEEGEDYSKAFVYEGPDYTLRFDAYPIEDRRERWNYLSKLPGVSSDDPEDLDTQAIKPDGEAITAIENMVLSSFEHPHYSESEMNTIVRERFTDEALFEAFAEIVEMSTDIGTVDTFRQY